MKKLQFLFLFAILLNAISVFSQPAERPVQVLISPDHTDFLYKEGEKVTFSVSVFKGGVLLNNVEVRYEISEDMMTPHKSETKVLKDGTCRINAGTLMKPGFLRCQVYAKYKEREYQGVSTVGFNVQKIAPVTQLPGDFKEFWKTAIDKSAKLGLDTKMTLIPERCTEKVNVYHVSVQNYEQGGRVYGMLSVPKGEGKYPAILKVPGAGIRAYNGDVENAQKGYIILEIGIHGIPVNLSGDVYSNLYAGALKSYHSFNLDNRDKYYYKRVYLGCVRAIDFIYSLPEFDGENLIAYGGSQGGALAIVTAALDNRVKALVSFYPALCDLAGYLHGRAGGWPHMFRKEENNTPANINTAQYYDVVNFARQIKVPGFYTFGYNDMVCPPTSITSALNVINAPKDILIVENTAHYAYPEQRQETWKWVAEFLKK